MNLSAEDERFLEDAQQYITDGEVAAAHDMLTNPDLTLDKACSNYAETRKIVVMALQGRLKEAVVCNGKVAPGKRYVDPWAEPACIDHKDVHQKAAFAIWRTLEPVNGEPQLFERGSRVN